MKAMLEINAIATNLELHEAGVWCSRTSSGISYPEDGNAKCFQVEEDSFWFRHRNACIIEVLRRVPPPGPILDVGGGNGFVSLAIQAAGLDAILLEPGSTGIRNARARGLSPVICSTLEDARFRPHSIPAVGLFDVLEHIEDDVSFLCGVRRLLIPGGMLYLTVPAFRSLWSNEDDHAGHYRRYTLDTLGKKLAEAEFRTDFATYIFSFLPLPILLFRALPYRLGVRHRPNSERKMKEHSAGFSWARRLVDAVLSSELRALRRASPLPFGGSCLVAARAR